jgi:hypothetical protein
MREYDYFSGNILIIEYDIKHVQDSNYDKTASTTAGGVFYSLDQLKPKTKTKNQIFLLITFRLCYTL